MSERMDTPNDLGRCPVPTGSSLLPNALDPRQVQNRAGEQSPVSARTETVLALFLWRSAWLRAFRRAFSTCDALNAFQSQQQAEQRQLLTHSVSSESLRSEVRYWWQD